ncbi:uncharacterized protein HD556DRAFT_913577 [Suillus plorans]|uniref:Uncharacterized protein n=1 Tax=Suillus plorans TaxID=116603 RepID=A0A9P7AF45_9AGAM|nr:uncharacterized protein HD556DRAFT_913577 [Suillus plorans]KAG1788121.1 hypothetical protein HD556DRAFT_913577 [Suillus plorans]
MWISWSKLYRVLLIKTVMFKIRAVRRDMNIGALIEEAHCFPLRSLQSPDWASLMGAERRYQNIKAQFAFLLSFYHGHSSCSAMNDNTTLHYYLRPYMFLASDVFLDVNHSAITAMFCSVSGAGQPFAHSRYNHEPSRFQGRHNDTCYDEVDNSHQESSDGSEEWESGTVIAQCSVQNTKGRKCRSKTSCFPVTPSPSDSITKSCNSNSH